MRICSPARWRKRCGERGVRFLFDTTVKSVSVEDGCARGVSLVDTAGRQSREAADAVVVCLGVESAAVLQPLGLKPLIYPGKGYSATFRVTDAAGAPSVSLTDDEYKLVFSRFGNRLRVAGTAEIGARGLELDPVRCAALTRRTETPFRPPAITPIRSTGLACDRSRHRTCHTSDRPASPGCSSMPATARSAGRWPPATAN